MSPRTILALTASAALAASIAMTTPGSAVATSPDRASDRGSATYVALKGGATTLRLNSGTAQALTDNGVSVAPASEARVRTAVSPSPSRVGCSTPRPSPGR